jgi:F0F1-type ATP synthase delta subunit
VQQFRLRETTATRIEVDLVSAGPLAPRQEQDLQAMLRRRLGHAFDIALRPVATIDRAASGKFEDFVSELGD